jgi:DNA-binding response OmpR family regulator
MSAVSPVSIIKKRSPETPVIAITGWVNHRALATEANADMVLNKPFEMEDLDTLLKASEIHPFRLDLN